MFGKFILLFIVWMALVNSFDIQEVILGIIVSLIVSYFFTDNNKLNLLSLIKIYIRFIPLFLKELLVSNVEVAKLVLSKKIDIDPSIVKLETTLKSDHDKLLLANAITLTPGTLTMELHEQSLYIHILDKKDKDIEVLQKEIVDKFEKNIK